MRARAFLAALLLVVLPQAAAAQASPRPCGDSFNDAAAFMAEIELAILAGDLDALRDANAAVADAVLYSAPDPFPPGGFTCCHATGHALAPGWFRRTLVLERDGSTCSAAIAYIVNVRTDGTILTAFAYVVSSDGRVDQFEYPEVRSWSDECRGETEK